MKHKNTTHKPRLILLAVTAASVIWLTGCATPPPQSSLPSLPPPPSVSMPPTPTVILQSVESDMQKWDEQQQRRLQQLGLTVKPGQQ